MAEWTKLIGLESIERLLRQLVSTTTYARTTSDQMRVVVDGNPQVNIYNANSGTNAIQGGAVAPAMFSVSSWNIMDNRETARIASEQQWAITRQRWTIT